MTDPDIDPAGDLHANDFTPGEVVAFRKTRAELCGSRFAAPEGALATVVKIDWPLWDGAVIVRWHDRSHGQKDGDYMAWMFRKTTETDTLF